MPSPYGRQRPRQIRASSVELRNSAANRDNSIRGLKAHLTGSRSITLAGHPGLEYTAESDQGAFKYRVYLVGNRVYQFAAIIFAGKDDGENVNKFLGSFAFK